jgi:ESS family glutamate:Na+ symporter
MDWVPQNVVDVLSPLPGLLINVVFAGVMIGKALPDVRAIWTESAPHVILGSVFSFGQFALSGLAVAFLLRPVFDLPDDLGLGLATISMITGVAGGSILVNHAIRSPRIHVARTRPVDGGDPTELRDIAPNSGDSDPGDGGLRSMSRSFAAITIAIAIGIAILAGLRAVARALGSDLFDNFPLFPFTVIGGFVVQAVLTRTGQEALIERRTVNDITGLSLDILIAAAIGTMSLAALGENIPSLVVLTLVALGWSMIGMLWLGPRIHPTNWFEHSIADYGQSQGNVATGSCWPTWRTLPARRPQPGRTGTSS